MNEVRSGLHQIDVRIFYVGGGAILGAHLFTRIHRLLANVNLCFLYSHLSTENAVLGKNGATVLFKGRARIDYNKHGRPTHAVVWQSGPLAGLILVLSRVGTSVTAHKVPIAVFLEMDASPETAALPIVLVRS